MGFRFSLGRCIKSASLFFFKVKRVIFVYLYSETLGNTAIPTKRAAKELTYQKHFS